MHVSFKTEILSLDGTQFIRPFIFAVPVNLLPNDSVQLGVNVSKSSSGPTAFADLFAQMIPYGTVKLMLDEQCSFLTGGLDGSKASVGGVTRVFSLTDSLGTPEVGKGCRFKFNNGAYIKLQMTAVSYYAGAQEYTITYSLTYYAPGDVSLGSISLKGTWYGLSGRGASFMPFPFAYPNDRGAFTDLNVRVTGEISSPYQTPGIKGTYNSNNDTYGCTWSGFSNYRYPGRLNIDLTTFFTGIQPIDEDDPYQNIPSSEPSGPAQGTGIPASDPVSIPNLPTVSLLDTGFVTLFNPSMADIKNLADYMWNNNAFDLANFKKIFANPMDCILGLNMVPVTVPATGSASVNIGNLTTSVSMPRAASQWQELDCGTLDLGLPLGNYMDYAPNSKYSIYLPYIGIQELSTDDVAGKALSLKYHVDLMSCACIAYLKCGDSVLYQFSGSCGYPIPVTENSWNNLYKAIAELAVGVGGAVATGGMSAGGLMNGAVDLIQGLKPEVHRSGAIGSAAGLMGIQKPFLIIEIPNICKPEKQYHYLGYPSFVTKKLDDISGFASFEEIILENIPCTEEEAVMIKNLCKGGIHL